MDFYLLCILELDLRKWKEYEEDPSHQNYKSFVDLYIGCGEGEGG